MSYISRSKVWNIPTLLYRALTSSFSNLTDLLDDGLPFVEKRADGTTRLVIGNGTKKPSDQNYIGESYYTLNQPTTITVGGCKAGTDVYDRSADYILQLILNGPQEAFLNSITHNLGVLEVGQSINAVTVTCNISNADRLIAGDAASIVANPAIFSAQDFDPRTPVQFTVDPAYQRITIGNVQLTVTIQGQDGESNYKSTNISWGAPIWYGSSNLTAITNLTELNTLNRIVSTTRVGTYNFPGNGYTYFCISKLFSLTGLSFVDLDILTNADLFTYGTERLDDITVNNGYIDMDVAVFRSPYIIYGPTRFRTV